MKPEPVEVIDFDEKQFRRHLTEIMRAADKSGFVGIKQDGVRCGYLVSAKFWRADNLDNDSYVAITNRGKRVACVLPTYFWEIGMSFVGSFTPAARRRLPGIARAAALRDSRWPKHPKKMTP